MQFWIDNPLITRCFEHSCRVDHLHGPVWRLARDDHDCQWHLAWDDQIMSSNSSQPRRKSNILLCTLNNYSLRCCMAAWPTSQINHMITIIRKSWPHHDLAYSFGLLWWQLEIRRALLWLHQSCTMSYDFMLFYICVLRSPFSILHLAFLKQNPLGCEMMWSLWQGFDWVEVETGGEPGRITERKAVTSCFSVTLGKFLLCTGRFFLEAMNGMCCQMSLASLASLVVGWSWLKPGCCYLLFLFLNVVPIQLSSSTLCQGFGWFFVVYYLSPRSQWWLQHGLAVVRSFTE